MSFPILNAFLCLFIAVGFPFLASFFVSCTSSRIHCNSPVATLPSAKPTRPPDALHLSPYPKFLSSFICPSGFIAIFFISDLKIFNSVWLKSLIFLLTSVTDHLDVSPPMVPLETISINLPWSSTIEPAFLQFNNPSWFGNFL